MARKRLFLLMLLGLCIPGIEVPCLAISRVEWLEERPPEGKQTVKPKVAYTYYFYASTQGSVASLGTATGTINNFGMSKQNLSARGPLAQGHGYVVEMAPHLRYFNFDTSATFPGTGTGVPEELYDIGLGFQILQQSKKKETVGFSVTPATVSDKPFKSDTLAVDATVFYRTGAVTAPGRWIYYVDYSNNRLFLNGLPLPGIGYIATPAQNVTIMWGLPALTADIRPTRGLGGKFRFFPSEVFSADATYSLSDTEWLAAGWSWDFDSFLLHGRQDPKQRTVLNEKHLTLELVATVLPEMVVRVSGGYAFGRQMYQGTSLSNHDGGEINLMPTLFGALGIYVSL